MCLIHFEAQKPQRVGYFGGKEGEGGSNLSCSIMCSPMHSRC